MNIKFIEMVVKSRRR